jgi:hypothetical protein
MFLINDILVSDMLFEEHFECDLEKCKGACCWEGEYGAPLTHGEVMQIEKILDEAIEILPEKNRIKINESGASAYYNETDTIGTSLLDDGSCVFLVKNRQDIGLCALETLYRAGKTDWKKPVSCELFPLRVKTSEIKGFEALDYYEWDICSPACALGKHKKLPVFRFVKNAIVRKYGEDFYHQLEIAYQAYLESRDE